MLEETTTHIKEDNSSPITDKIFFLGQGKDLFSIMLLNVLLTIITLGIYYPWAKASYLKYVYRETEFKGGRFTFHGTGKELFIGMIKALLVLIILISASFLAGYLGNPFYAYVVYIPALFFLYPLAIVGSLKYRTSRSSWNGIHFGYRGTYSSMLKVHAKGLFLTIITLGIYYAWYLSSLYKEILSNVRFGNIQLNYSQIILIICHQHKLLLCFYL